MSDADGVMVVPMHSRRRERAKGVQRLQHLLPAVTLLTAGVSGLRGGAHGGELALALLEVATSAALVILTVRSMRTLRRATTVAAHHGRVDWVELFAAAVLFTEALEKWVTHHHVARPILLMAFVTLGLALMHERVDRFSHRRRAMRITETGLSWGLPLIRHFRARWDEVAAITISGDEAVVVLLNGKQRRIDLADLTNAAEVRSALEKAQRRVPVPLPA